MEIALIPAAFFAGMMAGFLMAVTVGVTIWNRLREGE